SARQIGEDLKRDFEVIVVDDGSRDSSPHIISRWTRADARVRGVRHARNAGYGAALRSGLAEAKGDLVFFSDSDLQFDLAEIRHLLAHTRDFDIVAGYRFPRRDPWHRIAIARLWGSVVQGLFGLRVRDIDCAFKLFHRRVIEGVSLASVGAFINTELLVRARAAGFRIHEVPVTHRRRQHGTQTGARPRVLVRAALELGSLYRELRRAARSDTSRSPSRANLG
ncbi:MAG: glycosyltransferase family 2 protein, partial [Myxococcota bacterium]|nr:glycosyltransferase family 2 protein [Myxococcota bacterium]